MILKDLLTVINSVNAIKIIIHQLNRDRSIKSGFSYNFTDEYLKFIKTYLPEDLLMTKVVYCEAKGIDEFEVGVFY